MKKFLKKLKHLGEYLVFSLVIKLLKQLGIDRSASLCSIMARYIGPLLPVTKIARKNLTAVFGKNIDQPAIIRQLWDNFGRFIGEFPYMADISEAELTKRVEIIGLEHLVEFKNTLQPFLLFTGHFANWDFVLKISRKFYHKFGIIYRRSNNPYINAAINQARDDDNVHLIAKGPSGGKALITALKSGYAIAMLVDQKMNDGISVPFFGQPAMTAPAIAKFALQWHYPIIPCQVIRQQGSYFKVIIHPPLQFTQTLDRKNDCYNIMLKINQVLEDWIRQNPGQWLWFHNRWK